MRHTSAYWIKKLELEKHPEGGYFKEVYRSGEFIEKSALPKRFIGKRCFGTSIYFLLKKENISAFHMICSDETWHFYYGDTVYINIIDKTGNLNRVKLGNEPSKREVLQYTVPAGAWFAASISVDNKNNRYSYCRVHCCSRFRFQRF